MTHILHTVLPRGTVIEMPHCHLNLHQGEDNDSHVLILHDTEMDIKVMVPFPQGKLEDTINTWKEALTGITIPRPKLVVPRSRNGKS